METVLSCPLSLRSTLADEITRFEDALRAVHDLATPATPELRYFRLLTRS